MSAHVQISVFEPHHMIEVIYPYAKEYRNKLFPIHDSENRYAPRPLIADKEVTYYASRENEAESSIFTVTKATKELSAQHLEEASRDDALQTPFGGQGFLHELGVISSCRGRTTLGVCTHLGQASVAGTGNVMDVDMITIHLHSDLRSPDGEAYEHASKHMMTLQAFEDLKCAELWHQNILDVIYRKTNHAVRHVNIQLGALDLTDVPTIWKARRCLPYEQFARTSKAKVPNSWDEQDEDCPICGNEYDGHEHARFTPKCDPKHAICRADFLRWCQQKGSAADCPHCRDHYFDGPSIEFLKYGTTDGIYRSYDPSNASFNSFETFERTCARLDENHAADNLQPLTIDSRLIGQAWKVMTDGALREEASSTPLHLQPARSPEYTQVTKTLAKVLAELDKATMSTDELNEELYVSMVEMLVEEFFASDAGKCLNSEQKGAVWDYPICANLGLRPGFLVFVMRNLSRTLQFCHLRRCQCEGHFRGWHSHGEMMFYHPDHLETFEGRDGPDGQRMKKAIGEKRRKPKTSSVWRGSKHPRSFLDDMEEME
ncbi:hypothetical protein LTR36_005691 [Oleoguttula mirabilis]|uniref:Uncharacterized protein n=1 Tax=Oleoguttula mirabilis TaxID=1507867 RepID=A0AAV9JEX9_9PEZI|nr:hypothetical protein LTR36_005691 [Oleoguttula mirabilis]